jgi:hypothetical protein
MKHFLITAFIVLSSFIGFSQSLNGTYINATKQTLTITNHKPNESFDFAYTSGVNDEWGCLFNEKGTAAFKSAKEYITGDSEYPEIVFQVSENEVLIVAAYLMEYDCGRYGNSQSEEYIWYKKKN